MTGATAPKGCAFGKERRGRRWFDRRRHAGMRAGNSASWRGKDGKRQTDALDASSSTTRLGRVGGQSRRAPGGEQRAPVIDRRGQMKRGGGEVLRGTCWMRRGLSSWERVECRDAWARRGPVAHRSSHRRCFGQSRGRGWPGTCCAYIEANGCLVPRSKKAGRCPRPSDRNRGEGMGGGDPRRGSETEPSSLGQRQTAGFFTLADG
ncbi:hypothetical protein OF83DRAFT_435330 [Amylostereum chailletii]|nr:hypothetical protein OF83DRAFT_435330 [Amylostereum chailletii]